MSSGTNALRNSIISFEYLAGKSSTQIADEFDLSQVQISRIIRSRGLTRTASEGKKLSHARPEVKAKMSAASSGRKCPEHVKQILRSRTGESNHNWRSGVTINTQGYLAFSSSPANGAHAGRALHRILAEWKFGRAMNDGEHVHHIDGNKLNNDPNNLAIMSHSEHARLHAIENGLGNHKRKKGVKSNA